MDLEPLLLPSHLTDEQLEAEARRIYFDDLAVNPPVIPDVQWLNKLHVHVNPVEGALKLFAETTGWTEYSHRRTGRLCPKRMRRAAWIRPVLELKVPKTKIYSNNHAMGPREFVPGQKPKKNRVFITTNCGLYFISLVWLSDTSLVLATAFEPDGQWVRQMQKRDGTVLLGPPMHWKLPEA